MQASHYTDIRLDDMRKHFRLHLDKILLLLILPLSASNYDTVQHIAQRLFRCMHVFYSYSTIKEKCCNKNQFLTGLTCSTCTRVEEHAIFMCFLLTDAPCKPGEGERYKLCRGKKGCFRVHEGRATHTLHTNVVPEGELSRSYWYKRGHYDDLEFSFHNSSSRKHATHTCITLLALYISSLLYINPHIFRHTLSCATVLNIRHDRDK